jgi:hypothetical protein
MSTSAKEKKGENPKIKKKRKKKQRNKERNKETKTNYANADLKTGITDWRRLI